MPAVSSLLHFCPDNPKLVHTFYIYKVFASFDISKGLRYLTCSEPLAMVLEIRLGNELTNQNRRSHFMSFRFCFLKPFYLHKLLFYKGRKGNEKEMA